MLSIQSDNPNYLAKIVTAKNLRKHPNADRLQILTVDFQNVITGSDTKEGDVLVFFPLECKINDNFLSATNSFRHSEKNVNIEQVGFFEDNCRVRAVKLRNEKSMGYVVPVKHVEDFAGVSDLSQYVGQEFDTINGILLCEKYFVPSKNPQSIREGKKARESRILDQWFKFHVDTEQLRKNIIQINPDDNISVTYKLHGTSVIIANIPVKRKLGFMERALKLFGFSILETEYDYVYASRKVIKNKDMVDKEHNSFYDSDIWGTAKDELKDMVPKGYTFYAEIVGYLPSGSPIQSGYDYGCSVGSHAVYVYRITITNEDGVVHNLSTSEILELSEYLGFSYVPHFYSGKAKDMFPELDVENHWHEELLKKLEETYCEKNCFMCKNVVPEEGIVLRIESGRQFEAYKLESWKFFEHETEMLDKGESDIESEN